MNRRGFIATLTALAGLALVKIKAPAAAKLPTHDAVRMTTGELVSGNELFKPWPPGTKLIRVLDYTYNNGLNTCTERWLPAAQVAEEMNTDFDMLEKSINGVVCRFHQ